MFGSFKETFIKHSTTETEIDIENKYIDGHPKQEKNMMLASLFRDGIFKEINLAVHIFQESGMYYLSYQI